MIANFSKGSNVTSMILYNENKVSKGHATLSFTNNILVENPTVYKETFTNMIAGTKMEAPAFHCSLSFSPEENLSKQTMQDIAKRYMAEMGYSNQPYVVYEHKDTAHQHVHILSVNVDENNKRVPEWGDRYKSQKITRDIELEFGLKQTSSKKEKNIEGADLPKNFKTKVAKVAMMIKKDYQPSNIKEVGKLMSSFNIELVEIEKQDGKQAGFLFKSLDQPEQKPIKASHLYHSFNHDVLEKLYQKSAGSKKNFDKQPMIRKVHSVLKEKGINEQSLKSKLNLKGIDILYERYKDKTIYGISFVDNKSGLIFKGSELHRDFSFNKIKELIKDKPAQEINLKEVITKITNQQISETKKEMTAFGGTKVNRSEVLEKLSATAYENYIYKSREWLELPKADQQEAGKVIESKIKWLTGSGVTMAMANEGMQLYVQQHLRSNNQLYKNDPKALLASIQAIIKDIPQIYSEKNMLSDNAPLQNVKDRKDDFAWNMALDGVHSYTNEILKEKVISLLHQIEHKDSLTDLYTEKINNARAGVIEYITPEHLIFSEQGQSIIGSLADYCEEYKIKPEKSDHIIQNLFVNTIQTNELKYSIRNITNNLSDGINDPDQLSELYLSIHKEPFLFFNNEALTDSSKTLGQLYQSHNQDGQLDSTHTSTVNSQSELLLAKGSQVYLNLYFNSLYQPGTKLSEAFEKMTAEDLKASPMGGKMVERLTQHLHEDLKLDLDTANLKIDNIISNSIEQKKQQIPLIKIKENVNETFAVLYKEISTEANSTNISVTDFLNHPSAQNLNATIEELRKDRPNAEAIKTEAHAYILNKLFAESAKAYFEPYNENIASFKKTKHSQGETLLLDEAVRINENRAIPKAKLELIINTLYPQLEHKTKENIIERAIDKQFKKILGSSFNIAISKAYATVLKTSGIPQSKFIKEGNLGAIIHSGAMAGYLNDFRGKTEKSGLKPGEIDSLISGFTQQFIKFKEDQLPSIEKSESIDFSSLFTIKSRANRGLNDKKNKGLNH